MAEQVQFMGEMLPVAQWRVNLRQDGKAEVSVSHVNRRYYWYTVDSVTSNLGEPAKA